MNNVLENLNTSEKLKVYMVAKKFGPAELATLLGVTRETINNRLDGNRWLISDLKKISNAYGIEVNDLI
jgi:plasmid maintenance system antidote protein VapI